MSLAQQTVNTSTLAVQPEIVLSLYHNLNAICYNGFHRGSAFHLPQKQAIKLMTTDRIATVQPVEEDLASPRVSAVYDDIKATKNIDFIPNFWKVIAVNVDLLEQVWGQLKTLMHPETVGRTSHLTPAIREMIAVAVSATNGCSYCVNSHTAILKKHGVQDEAIGEVLAIAGLFNQTNSLADGFQIQSDVFPRLD